MQVRRFDDLTPAPWRNGGGTTREVMRRGSPQPGEDFLARVSIADVDVNSDFSRFDGVDRLIMLVRGPVMRLVVDGERTDLTPEEPFAFIGDASTRCEIDSPTRDLNVMTRRGAATATVTVVRGSGRHAVGGEGAQVVAVALGDGARVRAAGGDAARLAELDCVVGAEAETLTVVGYAAIIVIRVATR